MAQSLCRGFALGGAVPLILIAVLSAGNEVRHFFDPCFSWGDTAGTVTPSASCRGRMAGTSETRAGAVIRLVLIQVMAVGVAVVGLRGAYRSKPRYILAASMVLFILTLPLAISQAGLITLVCAACFLLSYLFCRARAV